ncbi:hypothetical protein EDD11_007988 [Mortierella claussenii]|nr:hypothetical protein EDD11_007988 [Mortierella claussenii]
MASTTQISQITASKIRFTAFQALWIPGTTKICSLGSDENGRGAIQVHALSTNRTAADSSPKRASLTSTSNPKLVLQHETEKRTQFKSGTFQASARSSSLPQLITGDFEGRIGFWDLTRMEVPLKMFKAHDDIVNCIDGAGSQTGRSEFVTGCRDGTVKLWDARQDTSDSKPICNMAKSTGYQGMEVWCVAVGSAHGTDDLMITAGYDNGDLRVMDIRMRKVVFETNINHGVCAVEFDRRQGKAQSLVATTVEGALHSFDTVNGQFKEPGATVEEVVAVRSGDDSTLWQSRHIPQRPEMFAVTDGGGNIHLYQHGDSTNKMTALGVERVATEGILSLDFNEDLEGLYVACDLDNHLRVGMVHL